MLQLKKKKKKSQEPKRSRQERGLTTGQLVSPSTLVLAVPVLAHCYWAIM